jgi:hypothetical protein
MHCPRYLTGVIIIFSLILVSGCTTGSGTPVHASPAPAPVIPESLVLTRSDVPQNFTLVESRAKNSTEVGSLAQSLGWQKGYVVRFIRPSDGVYGPIEILQTVTWYPAKNIPGIAELIERVERSDSSMTFSNLSLPSLGSYSRAFSGTANIRVIVKPETANLSDSESVPEINQQDFVEIIFSKGDILEVIRLTGHEPDSSLLTSLAQEAFTKIPDG